MDIVKLNWSGGKDSTASLLLHRESGHIIKAVFYIPMLCDDIPLITKKQLDFMLSVVDRYNDNQCSFTRANGISYLDHVYTIKKRGPNSGQRRGLGLGFGFCLFRDFSKKKALNCVDVGVYDYVDIGIAYNETRRLKQLDGIKKRSILFERGITEEHAFEICKRNECLSPVYDGAFRDGCVICPNARDNRLKEWACDYPLGREILLEIENEFNGPKDVIYRDGRKWSNII